MSDLTNLFTQRKKPSPPSIKRLFTDQSRGKRYNKQRSNEPHKSIRKYDYHPSKNKTVFTSKDFTKRFYQQEDLKKEISHYNNQILLVFIRKIFFVMSAVILFNILFTSSQQILILSNMMLSIVFIKIQLGKDLFSHFYFLATKEILKIIIYSLNFYLIFVEVQVNSNQRKDTQVLLIGLNGCINYLIQSFYRPFVAMQGIENIKKPYESIFQQLRLLCMKVGRSYKTIYHLRKPIIILNLLYWLIVLFYIMYQQSQSLLNSLINVQTVFSITLTTLLLHLFIQIIQKIDEVIIIDLCTPNQKALNMTFLRLDCQHKNNEQIANETVKYIWQNCEIIWDIDLLRHNYAINYDIIDDYLNMHLHKINQTLLRSLQKIKNISLQRKVRRKWFNQWKITIQQIILIHQITSLLQRKQYLFYVIEQIIHFQQYSNEFPINTKIIHRKIVKIDELLAQILQKITIGELKTNLNSFYYYLHHRILLSFQ